LPLFVDRRIDGGIHPGFLPMLQHVLGATSFHPGNEETRFSVFLHTPTPMAAAFSSAWQIMQREVADSVGPLSGHAAGAGAGESQLQKALTRQRERVKFQQLDVELRTLAVDDMRRSAWVNVDAFSTTWVSAWPHKDAYLSNEEFAEVATFYFGLPPGSGAAHGVATDSC
jgi:hypothetical protein